jgi:hypothetical protein
MRLLSLPDRHRDDLGAELDRRWHTADPPRIEAGSSWAGAEGPDAGIVSNTSWPFLA